MNGQEKIINIDTPTLTEKNQKTKRENFDNDIENQINDISRQIQTLIKSTQIIFSKNHRYGINNDVIQRLSDCLFISYAHLNDKKIPGSLYCKKLRNTYNEFNRSFEELIQILKEKLHHDDNKNNIYIDKLNRLKEKMLGFLKNQAKNLSMLDISEIGKFLNLIDDLQTDTRLIIIYRLMTISLERSLNKLYKSYNYIDIVS